jgi:hypothetical protein
MDKVAAKESLMKILADDVFWKYQVVSINRSTKTFAGSSDVIGHEHAYDEIMEHNENYQALIIGTNEHGSIGRMIDFDTL